MGYMMFTKKSFVKPANMEQLIKLTVKNIMAAQKEDPKSYKKLEIKQIGRLMEGQAYYHEVDQYYNAVGFEVEVETQFDFMDEPKTDVGFYSLWIGKCHSCAPYSFEESYQPMGKAYKYYNGCGDHIEVIKDLASAEEVQECIKTKGISLTE